MYKIVTANHGGVGDLIIVKTINGKKYWTFITIEELKTLLNI